MTREIDDDEQQVAEFVLPAFETLVDGFAQLAELFRDLVPERIEFVPVEAFARCVFLQLRRDRQQLAHAPTTLRQRLRSIAAVAPQIAYSP